MTTNVHTSRSGGWGIGGLLLLAALAGALAPTCARAAGYQMPMTFTNYTRAETLTNFPALVTLTNGLGGLFNYDQFTAPGNGGDLRFWDSTETTPLDFEIESWNNAGASYIWVRVPLLTSNTTIYAKWGGTDTNLPACTTNGAVWTNGFAGVWHLQQSAAPFTDSTSNRNDSTAGTYPTQTNGMVGAGRAFDGTTQYISIPDQSSLNFGTGDFCVSAWVKTETGTVYAREIVTKALSGGSYAGFCLRNNTGFEFWPYNWGGATAKETSNPSADTWRYVTGLRSSGNIYVCSNGLVSAGPFANSVSVSSATPLTFGDNNAGWIGGYWKGILDEVRISSVARSTNWLWAEYMTMASNAVFNGYGTVTNTAAITNLYIQNGPMPSGANLGATQAVVTATVVTNGGTAATGYLFYDTVNPGTNLTWGNTIPLGTMTSGTTVTNTITDLSAGTTYSFMYYATNTAGQTCWGGNTGVTFTTRNLSMWLITASPNPAMGGAVSPTSITVNDGDPQTLTLAASNYWDGAYVTDNGVSNSLTTPTTYALGSVLTAHTVVVHFAAQKVTSGGVPPTPAWWLSRYAGSALATNANADSDGDGMTNWVEWLAGTDPGDSNSVLEIVQSYVENGTNKIKWLSKNFDPDATLPPFLVQVCTNLAATGWSTAVGGIVSRPTNEVTVFTNIWAENASLAAGPTFHRVAVSLDTFSAPLPATNVRLPGFFTDNMMLQRDQPIRVWGWADPDGAVTVSLAGKQAVAKADAKGAWAVELPAMKNGENLELTVTGKNAITLKNIIVGDVWFCSGQSNMGLPVAACATNGSYDFPSIRIHCIYPTRYSESPQEDIPPVPEAFKPGGWAVCSPKVAGGCSGTAFYFAREVHQKTGVPIGLITAAFGGSAISFFITPAARAALASGVPFAPDTPPLPYYPGWCSIYNSMVNPVVRFPVKGVLWYQGEANGTEGESYFQAMRALVIGWRQAWNQPPSLGAGPSVGEFPFYFVQLAPWGELNPDPAGGDGWSNLREAQRKSLSITNTGMAVIIDTVPLSEAGNVHPGNKYDVGLRLARWALNRDYGMNDLVPSGPLFKSMTVEGDKVRLAFDYVGSGLMVGTKEGLSPAVEDKTGKLNRFAIAGADKTWVWADAVIDGQTVVVSSAAVPAPVAVRYAFSYNPTGANLYNREGLPASPFRTDDW